MIAILIKGIGLGLLLTISVGPVVFAALNISIRKGQMPGFAFVAGVSFSDIVLALAGNMAAELVRRLLQYETAIAWMGGLLLIGMGAFSYFFGKDARDTHPELEMLQFKKRDLFRFGLQGFAMNTFNPGSIIFWLTTCTAFAVLPFSERMVLFGACLATILVLDLAKVFFASRVRSLLTPRTLHIIHITTALLLVAFGVLLIAGRYIEEYF